jgi:hypothetical protein
MLLRWAVHLSFRCERRIELNAQGMEVACVFGDRTVTEFDRQDPSACAS